MSLADGLQYPLDGDILIVTPLPVSTLVFKRYGGEAIPPAILHRKGGIPQLIRAREGQGFPLLTGLHIDGIDALAIARIGKADGQLAGVILSLTHPGSEWLVPCFSFDHCQLGIAILQHIVSRERLAPFTVAFQSPQGDGVLAANAAAWGDAPASGHQHGVDMVAACLCFVLHVLSLSMWPTAEKFFMV